MTTTKARELALLRSEHGKLKEKALATIDGILAAELRVNELDSARRAGDLAACDAGAAAMRALARAQKRAHEAASRRDEAGAALELAEAGDRTTTLSESRPRNGAETIDAKALEHREAFREYVLKAW